MERDSAAHALFSIFSKFADFSVFKASVSRVFSLYFLWADSLKNDEETEASLFAINDMRYDPGGRSSHLQPGKSGILKFCDLWKSLKFQEMFGSGGSIFYLPSKWSKIWDITLL